MFDWLRKKQEAPLTGAPPVRRQKTYSAESGYVYQYFYEGQRAAERDGSAGAQYLFSVSSDRKSSGPVSVFLSEQALGSWQIGHGLGAQRIDPHRPRNVLDALLAPILERVGQLVSDVVAHRPGNADAAGIGERF